MLIPCIYAWSEYAGYHQTNEERIPEKLHLEIVL